MYRGKATAVDASGVYVQTAEYGTLGPCQAVVANYAVGDMVLCVNVGDEASPELVVVGRLNVGSSAGLDFGSSGPRMMAGTGGPSGISAPVGSTWRQADANASHGSLTGLLWTKVDTGTAEGTDWLVNYEGRWIDWTPTLTNITRGTGYSQRNRYTRSGKSLTFDFALNFGTSGSVTGGATMTLPVAPANTYEKLFPAMSRTSSQYSAGSLYHSGSTTTASFYIWGTSGTYLGDLAYVSAMPGSWDATGGRLSVSGTYEIA